MDKKSGRVVWFDCARYLFFVSLLCFEWNCFSFSLACFLLLLVRSWFLWNFVKYRSSWRHYEREKKMSMLVAWPARRLPCAWAENDFSLKFVRIGSVSLWIKTNKQINKQTNGGNPGGSSQPTHRRFRWIYVEMNQPSTFTAVRPPLLPSTVHAKYSSDPDRKNASLLSGSH